MVNSSAMRIVQALNHENQHFTFTFGQVEVTLNDFEKFSDGSTGESSDEIRARVEQARQRQSERVAEAR